VIHQRKSEMSEGEMESLSSEQTAPVRKSRGFFWKNPGFGNYGADQVVSAFRHRLSEMGTTAAGE
jgi:hypothetical protein